MSTMDFNDKVVLLTGAGRGVGGITALHFANRGASLALVSKTETNLKKVALYCEKRSNKKPLAITADVTNDLDVKRIIDETVNHFGKIDVLVNNAGVTGIGGIKDSSMETYDRVMSTNLRSVYQLTQLAVPHLVQSKGCIVNVSCTAGVKPNSLTLAYNISKAGLIHFTKCIALDLAGDGVRVNCISPSFVKTHLYADLNLSEEQLEMVSKNVIGHTPLKKPIEGEEVASLIAFLASDKAQSITGSNYVIDGGSLLN